MLGWMKRYLGIGVAWLAATVLSVVIASAAVAGIRDRVVETPVAIGAPTTSTTVPLITDVTTPVADPTTTSFAPTTSQAPATTEAPPATSTTVVDSDATTTTAPPATTTTTTTTAPPQTTTTVATTNQTYSLTGGTVTLSVGNGEVWVVSAVANAGFDTDIEKAGPDEVEVKFESNNHKSELSAKFENGELRVEKEEEPRSGDDD
jgi:hypothetical protein